jgi:putative (di)nucleoside polyphosphate hydrolase
VPEVYRSAASVVLLRPTETSFRVLLIHKPRRRDAWQLPQGGVEAGETIEQAALRELHEEAGISGVRVLGQSDKVYQYDFPPSFRRFRPDNVKGQKISYVFAIADVGTTATVDNNEIDRHAWVHPKGIGRYVRRREYLGLVRTLVHEALELAKQ